MVTFEEKHANFTSGGFLTTNEEPEVHQSLLKGKSFNKIAAIASGGEIIFSSLLPKTKKQLIAVDHSYRSICACYLKALMLQALGPRGMKKAMTAKGEEFKKIANQYAEKLPERLQTTFKGSATMNSGAYNSEQYGLLYGDADSINRRREWGLMREEDLAISMAKLDLLTFVHGDFTDIKDRGPFNLVYFSNALEHTDRNNKRPPVETLEQLVKDGGYVLLTQGSSVGAMLNKRSNWASLGRVEGYRTTWIHEFYKVTQPKPIKIKVEPPQPVQLTV